MNFKHETVLLHETIDMLNVKPSGIYVDCTLGGAGHARYLLSQLNQSGRLIAFDQDPIALENAKTELANEIESGRLTLVDSNFAQLGQQLDILCIDDIDGIYYDLGVSSPQFDQADRGFSYKLEARLDMRMDPRQSLSAYQVVNQWPYEELVRIIFRYGEERFAKRIARQIESQRKIRPIETTTQLAEVVKGAIPAATRRTGGHPAKRTFQAIRMTVNNELDAIEKSIAQGLKRLNIGGRLSVISFHSLEDRLVKQMFKEVSALPDLPANLPMIPDGLQPQFKVINRKPITASEEELALNHRSRSAKLRVIERIAKPE